MNKCKFCEEIKGNAGGLTMHERSCKNNPNRVPGTFKGKRHTEKTKRKQAKSYSGKVPDSLYDLSSRTKSKILKRLEIGCSLCGWQEGSCDLHHIVPRKEN